MQAYIALGIAMICVMLIIDGLIASVLDHEPHFGEIIVCGTGGFVFFLMMLVAHDGIAPLSIG